MHVKALFGGLELWKFSLDPNVVGEHTYLIELPDRGSRNVLSSTFR